MITSTFCLLVAGVLSAGTLAAQSPSDSDSLKLLRQTIADQKKYPDKVIRTYTNLPPAEAKSAAPADEPAPVAVAQSKPAQESKPAPPPSMTAADKKAAAAELERQFLNGKISERKYKKALADLEDPSKPPPSQTKSKPAPPTAVTPPTTAATPVKPPPGQGVATPTTAPPPSQPATNQQRVTEVESKIDDMIRQKEARESAAKTNATNAPPAPGAKMTKRQRLDFLLRQVIDGKLSDAEYKKEREKILAEPE